MVDHELTRVVFGIIANVFSIGLFASAVPTFYRVVKRCDDSVEDINPFYYLGMTFNCLFFVLYGLPVINPGNFLLLTAYGTGFILHIAYLGIYLLYASSRQRVYYVVSVFLTGFFVIGLFFVLVIGLGHTSESRSRPFGLFCIFITSFMLLPRARLTLQVMMTKSVECMPFLIALSDTLNGLCWCIYAALGSDPYLMTPNGNGLALGLYQLVLYCVYRSSSTSKVCDDEELGQTEHDKELAQADEHDDKKLALQLEHDTIKLDASPC